MAPTAKNIREKYIDTSSLKFQDSIPGINDLFICALAKYLLP